MTKRVDEIIEELRGLTLEDRDNELVILLENGEKYSYDEKIEIFKGLCGPTDFRTFARFLKNIDPELFNAARSVHGKIWPKTLINDSYHIALSFASMIRLASAPHGHCCDETDNKIIDAMISTLKL